MFGALPVILVVVTVVRGAVMTLDAIVVGVVVSSAVV